MYLDLSTIQKKLANVKMLVTDVDGVLTDGRLWIDCQGKWKRTWNVLDGVGLKRLMEAGYQVAVITGGESEDVRIRMGFLKIPHFYEGASNKMPPFHDLMKKTGLQPDEIAYIGDEVFDHPIMQEVAFSAAVPNAVEEVKDIATYVTRRDGGMGAVREVCELILKFGFHAQKGDE